VEKLTGSRSLGERFNHEILGNLKSFTRSDFRPLLAQYNDLRTTLCASTPDIGGTSTPRTTSRRPSTQTPVLPAPQAYWNEYDNGSEADENEPYTIYINPDTEVAFPGAKIVEYVFSGVKGPVEMVKKWLSPTAPPGARQPLLNEDGSYFHNHQPTDTEADNRYASSSDFPTRYAATFPSVSDQKLSQYHERLLFRATIASFSASLVLVVIDAILVATGRHDLRIEVDAGVIVGVVSSLCFTALGMGTTLYRQERLGWLHRICVGVTFGVLCVLNGILLVLVVGNTDL
jgi:hypothetical protein